MSMGMMLYWVPRAEMLAAPGCGDRELFEDIVEQMPEDIAELDDIFETADPEIWDGPTATEALEAVIEGRPEYDPELDEMYSAVYELLCRYYGGLAGNDGLEPCRTEWLARINELLASGGVMLNINELWTVGPVGGGSLKMVIDAGFWEGEPMRAAIEPLSRLIPTVEGREERMALEQISRWLQLAENDTDGVLVGFYH